MTVYMLVLLAAIALIITLVGLFLSSRTSAQTQVQLRSRRSTYGVPVGLERRQRQTDSVIPYRARRVSAYNVYNEPVRLVVELLLAAIRRQSLAEAACQGCDALAWYCDDPARLILDGHPLAAYHRAGRYLSRLWLGVYHSYIFFKYPERARAAL